MGCLGGSGGSRFGGLPAQPVKHNARTATKTPDTFPMKELRQQARHAVKPFLPGKRRSGGARALNGQIFRKFGHGERTLGRCELIAAGPEPVGRQKRLPRAIFANIAKRKNETFVTDRVAGCALQRAYRAMDK